MSRFGNLEFGFGEAEEIPARPAIRDEGLCLAEAQQAFEAGRFEQALRLFARALEFNPQSASSWAGQARMLIELGEFEEARLWADKALAILPDEGELMAAKAVALARLGDLEGAISFSDAAVESQANTPYIWIARGDVLLAAREKRAEFCFQKAIDLARGNWMVLWLIARIHRYHEQFARGLRMVQEALALDAGRAVLWSEFGQCQLALGLTAQARQSLAQARELDPNLEIAPLPAKAAETTILQKAAGRWKQWFRR